MTTVRRVALVGGGTPAWLCAAALKKALSHLNVDVLVIDTGRSREDLLGRWTLPSIRSIHSLLGIDERDLMLRTGATFRLASEHRHWQGTGSRYLHPHGEMGMEIQGSPFYLSLLKLAATGQSLSAEGYSLGAVAARMHKFARPTRSQNPLTSSFTYGLHLDDVAYRDYLRAHAERLGVRRVAASLRDIELLENGHGAALLLEGGERISADYFLDCSGRAALLMHRLDSSERQDWSAWLPNDRIAMTRAAIIEDPPAITSTDATDAGWLWRIPLAQSSIAGYVYSSAFRNDEDAVRQLTQYASQCSAPELVELRQGRRTHSWTRNCIAIGAAAIELEPLAGAELHLVQLGIATLIELFPIDTHDAPERREYNRILGEHADALRDFTIAHYRVGAGRTEAHWNAARAAPLPERLAEKLDLYLANGQLIMLDHETFDANDWAWLLLGSHCRPDAIGLHAATNIADVTGESLASLRASIARLAASMPRHGDCIRAK